MATLYDQWASEKGIDTGSRSGNQQPQQQATPKGNGLVGLLQGFGKSLYSPLKRTGEGIAELAAEATGVNQRERDNKLKQDKSDIGLIKSYGDRIKNAADDTERQRYRDALGSLMSGSDKESNNFQDRQKQIIERTDPIKNTAALADIGLTVAGGGLGGNLAKRGVLSGLKAGAIAGAPMGAVQGAIQTLEDKGSESSAEDLLSNSLTGGALGGIAGGALGSVANIPNALRKSGILNKAGKSAENAGTKLIGTQSNLTRAEGRKIGADTGEVLSRIQKRTGVSNLDKAAQIGKNITGENGAYSELVKNAIGNSEGVDIGNLRRIADDSITDMAPLLSNSQKKNILQQVQNGVTGAYGGSKGSLSTLANPLDALDLSRNFRDMASDISKGATVSAADKQLAKVYNKLGNEIEDRLYKTPGVEEGMKLAAPDRAKDLRNLASSTADKGEARAYSKLADELENIKSVKDARSLQKDFVDIGKIDKATAMASSGAGDRLGGQAQGLGKLVQRPLNAVALPLDAATPSVAGILSNAGRKLQGATLPSGGALGEVAGSPITSSLVNRQAGVEASQDQNAVPQPDVDSISQNIQEPSTDVFQSQEPDTNPFSSDNIQKLLLADIGSSGGKNIDTLLQLYNVFGKTEQPKTNATTQKALAQSANGLNTIDQLEGLYGKAGGGSNVVQGGIQGLLSNIGLDSSANVYNSQRSPAIASLAKAFGDTGTLSDSDIKRYDELLPKLTDTKQQAQAKFDIIRQRLGSAQQNTLLYGAGDGTESLLSQLGVQ